MGRIRHYTKLLSDNVLDIDINNAQELLKIYQNKFLIGGMRAGQTEERRYTTLMKQFKRYKHQNSLLKYDDLLELKQYLKQDLEQEKKILKSKEQFYQAIHDKLIEADEEMNRDFFKIQSSGNENDER